MSFHGDLLSNDSIHDLVNQWYSASSREITGPEKEELYQKTEKVSQELKYLKINNLDQTTQIASIFFHAINDHSIDQSKAHVESLLAS